MMKRPMTLAMAVAACAACSTKSASEYQTNQLSAQVNVIARGDGSASVSANFQDASKLLTFVQLTTDDKAEAVADSETKTMKESSLLGAVSYDASFNKDAADTRFRVRLTRKIDGGAPDSSGTLPAPFTLQSLAKSSYVRTEPVAVSWASAASGDPMTLEAAGSCLESYRAELGTGATSHTIPASALEKRTPSSATETVPDECEVLVTVTRSRNGAVDPAFKTGSFVARQVRTAQFQTKP